MHGAMPRPARVQVHDAELGKKDDGWKQASNAPSTPKWNAAVPRLRKRRWAALIMAMGLFYVFFKNIPEGLTPVSQRADTRVPGRTVNNMPIKGPTSGMRTPEKALPHRVSASSSSSSSSSTPSKPTKKPSKPVETDEAVGESRSLHYYDGDTIFPNLVTSLESGAGVVQFSAPIMFAAANLKSAAIMVPMACGMAQATSNEVHFAYFGRDDVPLQKLQEVNGVKGGCNATWHDARPNDSVHSSNERFEKAVIDAVGTIQAYLRPEVFVIVKTPYEERPLHDGLKSAAKYRTIIEVPHKKSENLMWLTRLDGKSLSTWRDLDIKVLIQVTKENVGGLFQLLKSIYTADYTGHSHPHIILEIPADLDIPSLAVANDFSWPPREFGDRTPSKVTIRKRVSRRHEDPLTSAIRTVENFYPTNPVFEHIMILSANVELSPMWYHYLVYNVLEYAYSSRSASQFEPVLLAGISLITPLTYPDNETPFKPPRYTPPALIDPDSPPPEVETPEHVPFMWQVPDTMATLYLGAKWKELHSFLSLRIETAEHTVTRKMPQSVAAVAEPLNELMSLRGWSVLYPNLQGHKIAAYRPDTAIREEFMPQPLELQLKGGAKSGAAEDRDPYASAVESRGGRRFSSPAELQTVASTPIHNMIPNNGVLPVLRWLPILDFAGKLTTTADSLSDAASRRNSFRQKFGRCPKGVAPVASEFTAEDLFCMSSGEPYNAKETRIDAGRHRGPNRQRMSEDIKAKINEVNGASEELDVEDEESKKREMAQMQNEFLEHLQRQSSPEVKASATNHDQAKVKPNSSKKT